MAIEVEVFGALVPKERRRQAIDTDKPLTVGEIVSRLGLESEAIGLATIDGVQSSLEDVVPPGSRLCLFPPMSGG